MPQLKPYEGPTRQLYVCFDVGTTYSGISYCIATPGVVPEIRGVTRFPGQEQVGGNAKVPSILYYNGDGDLQAAGADALLDDVIDTADIDKWAKAEWFKLHLAPRYDGSSLDSQRLPPLPPNKTVEDVFTDFLKYLAGCLKTFITDSHPAGDTLWNSLIPTAEFTLTHPNGWGGPQQAVMRDVAMRAGLVGSAKEGRRRVHFVTEGEASLHFCIHNGLSPQSSTERSDGVILVDAGGGTIDLSAYVANSGSSPVTFSEIAASKCIFEGSVSVTQRAGEYFQAHFAGSNWEQDVSHMKDIFDKSTKLTIKNEMDSPIIRFSGANATDPKFNVRCGKFRIPSGKAAEFFKPSIEGIESAVAEQMAIAQDRGKTIKLVYVVGGFGASDLLFSRLKNALARREADACRPDAYVNKAVADGGVLFLVTGSVTTRVSRYTYGMSCDVAYLERLSEHRRREQFSYIDASGVRRIPNAFATILPMNTQVDHEREFRYSFLRHTRERPQEVYSECVELYKGSAVKPEWVDVDEENFSELCEIEGDSRLLKYATCHTNKKGKEYWTMEWDVVLLFGLTELQAQIAWFDEHGKEQRRGAHHLQPLIAPANEKADEMDTIFYDDLTS